MARNRMLRRGLLAAAAWLAAPQALLAAGPEEQLAQDDRIAELERKVEVLTDELERTRADMAVPESKLDSVFGLGPAASKVYGLARGLSLVSRAVSTPEKNINWSWGLGPEQSRLPAYLYVLLLFLGFVALVFVPTHAILRNTFP